MKHAHLVKVLVVFALPLLLGGIAADQKFSDTTQVTVVEVPVQVSRDGAPVRGLRAEDFTILEGRKERPITGFDVVDLEAPQNQTLSADIPAAGRRHFLLLFDMQNSRPKSIAAARLAVLKSLVKTLTPSDLVAVAVYSPATGTRLLLGFTSDLYQVSRVLSMMGAEKNFRPEAYDNGWKAGMVADMAQSMAAPNISTGNGNNNQPPVPPNNPQADVAAVRQMVMNSIANNADQTAETFFTFAAADAAEEAHQEIIAQKNLVTPLAGAFTDLAKMMRGVSGRKLVVLFSEGFDMGVVSGTEDFNGQQAMADATMRGASLAVDNDARFGNTALANMLENMLEQFRRSDCIIESVDIAGLRGQDLDANVQSSGEGALLQMAHDTGGQVFRNTNDLGNALVAMAKLTSVTYVLSFSPEALATDGSYHQIKVELKNAPHGTKLTYRAGYFAPLPWNEQRPVDKMLALSNQINGSNTAGSIQMAVLAEPFRTAGAKAYVPVFVEADGATLLSGDPAAKAVAAEIYVYAVDTNGIIQDYFNQGLQLDLAKAGPRLKEGGLKYYGHLELPPGQYAVRALVRNTTNGAFGKRTSFLRVPEFGAGGSVLLPPLFPEAAGRWAVVRESPRGQLKAAAYPFTVGQQSYIPASLPALQAGEEVPVAIVGYHLGQNIQPAAELETTDGKDLGACTLRMRELVPGTDSRPDVYRASFQAPAGLAPGGYRLRVTVDSGSGPTTVESPFSIAAPPPPPPASR